MYKGLSGTGSSIQKLSSNDTVGKCSSVSSSSSSVMLVGSEPVSCPQVRGLPFKDLVRIHCLLCKSVSSALHGGNQEMGMLWELQV